MKKQSKIKNIKENKIEKNYIDKMDKSSLIKNMFQSLVLICAGLCIFYGLYSIFFGESKTQNQTAKLEYKDVRKLYGYLSETWPISPFHKKDEVLLSNIDENTLFSELIVSEELNKKTYEIAGCTDYNSPCKIGEISYDDAINKLKAKYGDVKLTKDSYTYNLISCKKEDNVLNCYIELGGMEDPYNNLSMITNYVETDEKLEIYDKYLKYVDMDDETKCYVDDDMTIECDNQKSFNTDLRVFANTEEYLLEKYGREYVHTYLKDKNGSYYWYSSVMK